MSLDQGKTTTDRIGRMIAYAWLRPVGTGYHFGREASHVQRVRKSHSLQPVRRGVQPPETAGLRRGKRPPDLIPRDGIHIRDTAPIFLRARDGVELTETLKLAVPIALTQLGQFAMMTTDRCWSIS